MAAFHFVPLREISTEFFSRKQTKFQKINIDSLLLKNRLDGKEFYLIFTTSYLKIFSARDLKMFFCRKVKYLKYIVIIEIYFSGSLFPVVINKAE